MGNEKALMIRMLATLLSHAGHQEAMWEQLRKEGSGGAEGIRTPDPLLAKQVLSQLSYSPEPG